MPWYKKYVTWRVDGKKTKTIPAGKTGTSTRKKLSIQYDLRGGQETKKLPRTYRFGDSVTLPETVKRKGYVFMGWSDKMYADVEKVESGQKKAKFYATWYGSIRWRAKRRERRRLALTAVRQKCF